MSDTTEKERIEKYISKLKMEIVMSEYNNGWLIKWCEEKIEELNQKLKEMNDDQCYILY